ncbi:GCIP-interacting family protein [Actinidia rufa]|uniref:GCIP-interacting family protein n=1 Tax=Actinidia rufa TaxID=165716 RepID=A0A7J0DVM6_9ERIC|nr:GCIP-interacting family protein [Actinidia rufa]
MTEKGRVHADCRNASNPYPECSDHCFRIIAEAKARMDKNEQGVIQASVGKVDPRSVAVPDSREDQHDEIDDLEDHPNGTVKLLLRRMRRTRQEKPIKLPWWQRRKKWKLRQSLEGKAVSI